MAAYTNTRARKAEGDTLFVQKIALLQSKYSFIYSVLDSDREKKSDSCEHLIDVSNDSYNFVCTRRSLLKSDECERPSTSTLMHIYIRVVWMASIR